MSKDVKKTKKSNLPEKKKSNLPEKKKGGFPQKKSGSAPAKKKALPIFKAPADFKPHFLLVSVTTEKDGLLASNIGAVRYQGKFDRDAEDKKKSNLANYDVATLIGIQARIAAVTYKANAEKKFPVAPSERAAVKGAQRLPANTSFQILLRVGKKAADQSLTASVKGVFQVLVSAKTGRTMNKELEKTDPVYRALRKSARILPAAFKNVLMPPKRSRKSAQVEEE